MSMSKRVAGGIECSKSCPSSPYASSMVPSLEGEGMGFGSVKWHMALDTGG
jgi:hypothetical protein